MEPDLETAQIELSSVKAQYAPEQKKIAFVME
jgi:hypothetical protein